MRLKHFLLAVFVAALSMSAWALPSVQDVESAVKQGQYARAESMMKEVVDAKPNSAKGHYLYAEILARNGRYTQATEEARAAERIDPAIGFTQPEKFREFQRLLAREQSAGTAPTRTTQTPAQADSMTPAVVNREPAARTAETRSSGIPGWVWLAGLLALGFGLFRAFRRSRAAPAATAQPGYGAPAGYGPGGSMVPGGSMGPGGTAPNAGYPQAGMPYGAQPPGRQGPGWVGTGLAAAGGVAAGMMLDRALNQNDGNAGHQAAANGDPGSLSDLSRTSTFGTNPNDAARELQQRDVDFGTGNEWGGDASSFDSGGSSSGSDDWT